MTPTTDREMARARARAQRATARDLVAALDQLADSAHTRADAARRLADNPDDPAAVLDLLAALADNARKPRPAAVLDRLTTEARATAVDLARATGATWQAIGDALGTSRQQAQTRYAARKDA